MIASRRMREPDFAEAAALIETQLWGFRLFSQKPDRVPRQVHFQILQSISHPHQRGIKLRTALRPG